MHPAEQDAIGSIRLSLQRQSRRGSQPNHKGPGPFVALCTVHSSEARQHTSVPVLPLLFFVNLRMHKVSVFNEIIAKHQINQECVLRTAAPSHQTQRGAAPRQSHVSAMSAVDALQLIIHLSVHVA